MTSNTSEKGLETLIVRLMIGLLIHVPLHSP